MVLDAGAHENVAGISGGTQQETKVATKAARTRNLNTANWAVVSRATMGHGTEISSCTVRDSEKTPMQV